MYAPSPKRCKYLSVCTVIHGLSSTLVRVGVYRPLLVEAGGGLAPLSPTGGARMEEQWKRSTERTFKSTSSGQR